MKMFHNDKLKTTFQLPKEIEDKVYQITNLKKADIDYPYLINCYQLLLWDGYLNNNNGAVTYFESIQTEKISANLIDGILVSFNKIYYVNILDMDSLHKPSITHCFKNERALYLFYALCLVLNKHYLITIVLQCDYGHLYNSAYRKNFDFTAYEYSLFQNAKLKILKESLSFNNQNLINKIHENSI